MEHTSQFSYAHTRLASRSCPHTHRSKKLLNKLQNTYSQNGKTTPHQPHPKITELKKHIKTIERGEYDNTNDVKEHLNKAQQLIHELKYQTSLTYRIQHHIRDLLT